MFSCGSSILLELECSLLNVFYFNWKKTINNTILYVLFFFMLLAEYTMIKWLNFSDYFANFANFSNYFANRPFFKMAAENSNTSKLATDTSIRKDTFTVSACWASFQNFLKEKSESCKQLICVYFQFPIVNKSWQRFLSLSLILW